MVILLEPKTLVKFGNLEGNLEPALGRFDTDFRIVPAGDPQTIKYTLWKSAPDPYWIMLTQNQRPVHEGMHNSVLILTSPDDEANQRFYRQFVETTGFEFREPDPVYERFAQEYYAKLFPRMIISDGIGIKRFPRILTA